MFDYPEEENPKPSLSALRAYDATWAIARAVKKSHAKFMPDEFIEKILSSNFQGLSGKISFKDGKLLQLPTFDIIHVIGRSYKELVFWSPALGFSKNLVRHQLMEMNIDNGSSGILGTIYWPGGLLAVPNEGTNNNNIKQPLRIGVPANGAFKQFVNVSYDQIRNQTSITGFSIDVFNAAVKRFPHQLPYVFVPFYGSYDEMVEQVYNKKLDAAVGDTEIMAYRYQYVEFSHPYVESGLEMIVTVKPDKSKETWMFMQAFTKEMWLIMAAMHIFIGFVIWLIEREVNPELRGFGAMLWFLVTVLFYAHREQIRSPLARIVLTPWLFVILIVTTSFTASLTSMLTISQIEPSILDVETLLRTNAFVGCNGNSFIVRYLIEALHFKPENIRRIASIRDYPAAFKNNDIKAAFFVCPHAKVFLSMYCKGYMKAGNTFKLGGFGYAFPKNSTLVVDMSVALLNLIESRVTEQLEKNMLSNASCPDSKSQTQDGSSLGVRPFSGLFCICGSIAVLALLYTLQGLLAWNVEILMLGRIWTRVRSLTRVSPAAGPEANNNPREITEQSPLGIQLVDAVMIPRASNQVVCQTIISQGYSTHNLN
ncbi:hypothetical protein L6164_009019 [Bauhinia variegata]|uniref:Uncharacterized protein n=1 Tax=Bauhinia variegata TaxID=167791 RepID=A0ACB9PHK7_BAUVA|nr:hypothetical protein L6164_009019 [Bauhinia variegata]